MATESSTNSSLADLLRGDAVLPADLEPDRHAATAGAAPLVTGATGFLGRYLVRELLARPLPTIVCLVRAADEAHARARLRASLTAARVDWASSAHRLHVLVGAIDRPRLGLGARDYREMAARVGEVYHCAAEVNWARNYRRLRSSNVLGTLELIRFACSGPIKRVYFSSSIAVCFARSGPSTIDEATDMLPFVERMPLPYARSKCVAESLLRSAADRGLPVSVIRPALISGDSTSGEANSHDLISALIQGCIASGTAIDSDWQVDCVPVDFVARVLAKLGDTDRPHWEVLNLFNEHSRHWREVILWLNLYGYPVQLVTHQEWINRTFERGTSPEVLFGYRRFFGAASSRLSGPAPYETYLGHAQTRVRNVDTRRALRALGLEAPRLNVTLMERYLEHYIAAGTVPSPSRKRATLGQSQAASEQNQDIIAEILRDRGLKIRRIREQPFASGDGIFNEVSSARLGGTIGIRRYDVTLHEADSGTTPILSVLWKTKPADTMMEDILVEVATLCDTRLGSLCAAFRHDLGLAGCHERELAFYESTEPQLRRHMPRAFGTHRDPAGGTWSIAMEYLPSVTSSDEGTTVLSPAQLTATLRALADIHATWYERSAALRTVPWLVSPPATERMLEMMPLWHAFASHSERFFTRWLAAPLLPLQQELIASLDDWWPALRALPQTLIHNDFNPRNLVLHGEDNGPVCSILDWEMATVGVPQHDLAELLCYVLPRECNLSTLARILEQYRRALLATTGVAIDRKAWLEGFALSLRHLLLNRLPLYTLIHRFKPQSFLPRVVRNWAALYKMSDELVSEWGQQSRHQAERDNQHRHGEQVLWPDTKRPTDADSDDVGNMRNIQ